MADDMGRLATCVKISHRPQHHAAGGDNRFVGWAQKLLGPVCNRTATLDDGGILNVEDSSHTGEAPALHRLTILQIAVGLVANRFIFRCELIENLLVSLDILFIHRCAATKNDVVAPMVGIV